MLNQESPPVLIVPGLRDQINDHWQSHLALDLIKSGRKVHLVPPMGRDNLDCHSRVMALDVVAQVIDEPFVMVAHSGGCLTVAHWCMHSNLMDSVIGCLLAVPPDFETPMPEGYPTVDQLSVGGWLPVPRGRLPFPSWVCASHNDPLGTFSRTGVLALDWGSQLIDLGRVGHLNPASGYGHWPEAVEFVDFIGRSAAGSRYIKERG
jgi:uncharacterized protein